MSRRERWVPALGSLTSSSISDALDGRGLWSCVDPRVVQLTGAARPVFGQAVTVSWAPARKTADIKSTRRSTWDEVRDFLVPEIRDGAGKVYVAGAGPLLADMALAGGMSCTYFERIGFAGVFLGGAVRDAATLSAIDMPVFATNFTPADTQGAYRVAEVGGSCVIGSLVVRSGDWIFADRSGAVVIPDPLLDEVLEDAMRIEETEARILARIRDGASLVDIVDGAAGRI